MLKSANPISKTIVNFSSNSWSILFVSGSAWNKIVSNFGSNGKGLACGFTTKKLIKMVYYNLQDCKTCLLHGTNFIPDENSCECVKQYNLAHPKDTPTHTTQVKLNELVLPSHLPFLLKLFLKQLLQFLNLMIRTVFLMTKYLLKLKIVIWMNRMNCFLQLMI